ncbi:hypothetical protein CRG98_004392, partial [Punica granatum]
MGTISHLHPFPVFYICGSHRKPCLPSRGWLQTENLTSRDRTGKLRITRGAPIAELSVPKRDIKLFAVPNSEDGHIPVSTVKEEINSNHAPISTELEAWVSKWSPPRYLWRGLSVLVLAGQ